MEDSSDGDVGVGDGCFGAVFGEFTDADDIFRLQVVGEFLQGGVAVIEEGFFFFCGEFVGGEVCAGFGHEDEGAVVPDEELVEEGFGGLESVFSPSP